VHWQEKMKTGGCSCRPVLGPEEQAVFEQVAAESGRHLLIPSFEGPALVLE
jgi:hypothetical protein